MLLSLRSLQDAHEHIDRQLEPSVFSAVAGESFTVAGPVTLSFDIDRQEPGRYRLAGDVRG